MNSLGKGERNLWCVRQDKARQTFGANCSKQNANFVGSANCVASRVGRLWTALWHSPQRVFALGIAVLVASLVTFPEALRLRLNLSKSMPRGLYRVTNRGALRRASLVAVCIDHELAVLAAERHYIGAGSCPTGTEPLLKVVVAEQGDVVETSESAVSINGARLAASATSVTDSAGRVLEHFPWGEHRLAHGEFWVFSERDRSWDSRYFGPVRIEEVAGVVEPLLTIE
jgi:conjugative transfer signal peptidase TraF